MLAYDPDTGVFTRRVSSGNQMRGNRAGTHDSRGHIQIRVNGVLYGAHRLAWVYMTGAWPKEQIDHRNGVRDDNRWTNLRPATHLENVQNQVARRDNKTGYLGVHRIRKTGRYCAQITVAGEHHVLGVSFKTPQEAHAAYLAAKRDLHPFQPIPRDCIQDESTVTA